MIAALTSVLLCAFYLYLNRARYRTDAWHRRLAHSVAITAIVWLVQKISAGAMLASIAASALYIYYSGVRAPHGHKILNATIDGAIFTFVVLISGLASRALIRALGGIPSWNYLAIAGICALVSGTVILISFLTIFLLDRSKRKVAE